MMLKEATGFLVMVFGMAMWMRRIHASDMTAVSVSIASRSCLSSSYRRFRIWAGYRMWRYCTAPG